MYKKVLVPYDKSDPSRRALAQALDLVACAPDGEESERVMEDIAGIPGCADVLGDGGRVSIAVVNGSPHDAITAYADEGGYDCIVMGHRGMGAMRGVLGSVCYSTLHKTSCPVLVVK